MNYEVLVVIVLINAAITFELWRQTSRKPPRPNRRLIRSLWNSKPIIPKHTPPTPTKFSYEGDRHFFSDFSRFADAVNGMLANDSVRSRWRLQELSDTLIADISGPDFGRTYAVFHNQEKIGKIQISGAHDYGTKNYRVHTRLQLRWVRLLDFDDLSGFLRWIAEHVVDHRPESIEYIRTRQIITDAMLKVLWDTHRIDEDMDAGQSWGDLSFDIHGTPTSYLTIVSKVKQAAR
jgi:hypothetical protein